MLEPGQCAEIVRIRPKAGAEQRLLEMRDSLVQSYKDAVPGFRAATLIRVEEGGTWVDLWYWSDRAAGEASQADPDRIPLFKEWADLVEMVDFEWAEVISNHVA